MVSNSAQLYWKCSQLLKYYRYCTVIKFVVYTQVTAVFTQFPALLLLLPPFSFSFVCASSYSFLSVPVSVSEWSPGFSVWTSSSGSWSSQARPSSSPPGLDPETTVWRQINNRPFKIIISGSQNSLQDRLHRRLDFFFPLTHTGHFYRL